MSQSTGPRLLYPCEAVAASMADQEIFSLENHFSTILDEDERGWQLREFFTPLLVAVQLGEGHFLALDVHFTTLLPKALRNHPSTVGSGDASQPVVEAHSAKNILKRLPELPQRLFALPFVNSGNRGTFWDRIRDGAWAEKYVLPDAQLLVRDRALNDANYPLQSLPNTFKFRVF